MTLLYWSICTFGIICVWILGFGFLGSVSCAWTLGFIVLVLRFESLGYLGLGSRVRRESSVLSPMVEIIMQHGFGFLGCDLWVWIPWFDLHGGFSVF